MTYGDDPMKPAIVDLDEEEAEIKDPRTCPVCRVRKQTSAEANVTYPTFQLMLRHWERAHPYDAPSSPAQSEGNEGALVRLDIDKQNEESLDCWMSQEIKRGADGSHP